VRLGGGRDAQFRGLDRGAPERQVQQALADFERDEAVTRAVWILVEGPALLAG